MKRRSGSDRERSRTQAEILHELEMGLRAEGTSYLIYDEKHDLFRFPDGRFAFSKTGWT